MNFWKTYDGSYDFHLNGTINLNVMSLEPFSALTFYKKYIYVNDLRRKQIVIKND